LESKTKTKKQKKKKKKKKNILLTISTFFKIDGLEALLKMLSPKWEKKKDF